MRIIAGKHRGRNIIMKEGKEIRPTSSMAREAIFNILSHGEFGEAEVLSGHVADLFCGSGALGLEALSRGAQKVTFVDQSQDSLNLVRESAKTFKEMENVRFVRSDSSRLPTPYDPCGLVFLDPPYNTGLAPKALKSLADQHWLKDGAICVAEVSNKEHVEPPEHFELLTERRYGNANIAILRYSKPKQS